MKAAKEIAELGTFTAFAGATKGAELKKMFKGGRRAHEPIIFDSSLATSNLQ